MNKEEELIDRLIDLAFRASLPRQWANPNF